MKKELISVVIPTYNRGFIIENSIRSVLNQTYKNIEVIIVDDGSTDNTEEVIKSINDKKIRYFKLKVNRGACYARNYGVSKAKGKYIAFQDSDDIFLPEKLEKQYVNLIKNNSDLDFCRIRIVNKNISTVVPTDNVINNFKKNGYFDELCNGNFISTQAILIKKEVFSKVKFDEKLPRIQDYDFVLRISYDYIISFTENILVDLYRYGDNISYNTDNLKRSLVNYAMKKYKFPDSNKFRIIECIVRWLSDECSYNMVKEKDEYIFNLNSNINVLNSEIKTKINYINELENKCNLLESYYNSMIIEIKKQKDDCISELNSNIDNLNDEIKTQTVYINKLENKYNLLENSFNKVVYSKRWKFINKVFSFKDKFKK